MQVALKFGSATIPSLSSYAFFLVFGVIVYMIPEDILKTSNRIHNLDELALKFYSYINNNPGKRIAFWGHTYQTKKLIIDYEKMLNELENGRDDVVFGSRWIEKQSPPSFHTIENRLITWFANLVTGGTLTDMASCYKMMSAKTLHSLNITSKGFGLEAEITAKVFKRKLTVMEIPIDYERRGKSEGKKLRLKDGLIACWTLLRK